MKENIHDSQFTTHCFLSEIFASFQGEGLFTGQPMTFVRFAGCSKNCTWCDTNQGKEISSFYRVESQPGSGIFKSKFNPVDTDTLNGLINRFSCEWIAITGGEPLEQTDFLQNWLPQIKGTHKLLLETNGLKPEKLKLIGDNFDIISMDIKLPSSGSCNWDLTKVFLKTAENLNTKVYAKMVVDNKTSNREIITAGKHINELKTNIPVILQPVTTNKNCLPPNNNNLENWKNILSEDNKHVFIMPQMHTIWNVK